MRWGATWPIGRYLAPLYYNSTDLCVIGIVNPFGYGLHNASIPIGTSWPAVCPIVGLIGGLQALEVKCSNDLLTSYNVQHPLCILIIDSPSLSN